MKEKDKIKIFVDGKIYTVDDTNPFASSVVIKGNKIVYVGDEKGNKEYKSPAAEVIDLQGKLMLPGFIDSHLHLMTGGFQLMNVDFSKANSKSKFQDILKKSLERNKIGWILGGNLNPNQFPPESKPNKGWIDEIVYDKPVYITCKDLHESIVNSNALELAGITKDSANPDGGIIEKNEFDGDLTGFVREKAKEFIEAIIPEPSEDIKESAFKKALNEIKKYGITSVHDIAKPQDLNIYKNALERCDLTCRINAILPIEMINDFAKIKISYESMIEIIRIGSLKAFSDGSLSSNTAWFFDHYVYEPSNYGLPMDCITNGTLKKMLKLAAQNIYQPVVHAIGDRAIAEVLGYFEEVDREYEIINSRWRIEHVQHIKISDINRLAKLGVVASMQPYHLIDDAFVCESKIGMNRLKGTYSFKSLIDSGINVCFGSDWTVAEPNVLKGIHSAVTRNVNSVNGPNSWQPQEKISIAEALRCYTICGAYASFEENFKGSIEIGKVADLVILNENIFEIPADEIKNVNIDMTIFNGKIVFEK